MFLRALTLPVDKTVDVFAPSTRFEDFLVGWLVLIVTVIQGKWNETLKEGNMKGWVNSEVSGGKTLV